MASEPEPKFEAPVPEPLPPEDAPSLIGEFVLFLREEKKWWLGPLIGVLLLLSIVLIWGGQSAIAPFIYAAF